MMLPTLMIAAQALGPIDLPPMDFYIAGVRQGMTIADYDALIAGGRHRSRQTAPNMRAARIGRRDLVVTFCRGRVARVSTGFTAAQWLRTMALLDDRSFRFTTRAIGGSRRAPHGPAGSMTLWGQSAPGHSNYDVLAEIGTARGRPVYRLTFDDRSNCGANPAR